MTPFVVVFPRGQLTPKDKERLTRGGVIAVEADDPTRVMQLNLSAPLTQSKVTGDAIVVAAVQAISTVPSSAINSEFVKLLAQSLSTK